MKIIIEAEAGAKSPLISPAGNFPPGGNVPPGENLPPCFSGWKFSPKDHINKLKFVVKEHHATRPHFDLRFEIENLISWVISYEGPTLNPYEIRNITRVGDHDIQYINREGIVPKYLHGVGQMIVWDGGTYFPLGGGKSKNEDREIMKEMFNKGAIHIFILGNKIKGGFSIINNGSRTSWILIKRPDEYCSNEDLRIYNKSVISGITIDDLKGKSNDDTDLKLF